MRKIAITMGDPSGIGPEISLKMLANHGEYKNDCIISVSYTHLTLPTKRIV